MSPTPAKGTLTISDDCIACGACAGIAPDCFEMTEDGSKAVVIAQPADPEQVSACEEAVDACPVEAIRFAGRQDAPEAAGPAQGEPTASADAPPADASPADGLPTGSPPDLSFPMAPTPAEAVQPILGRDKVRATLERHPELKPLLMGLSPAFKRLGKPLLYNTVARFASFHDAARISGLSVCSILHTLNEALGVSAAVVARFPECLQEEPQEAQEPAEAPWDLSHAARLDLRDAPAGGAWIEDAATRVRALEVGRDLVILSDFRLDPLEALARQLGFRVLRDQPDPTTHRLALRNEGRPNWLADSTRYEVLDVRAADSDPFDRIIKRAYRTEPGGGFVLVQSFLPDPIINMLSEMGFEHRVEQRGPQEFRVTFHKPEEPGATAGAATRVEKVPVVLQSATPVAYPILMRLLQSERLRERVVFRELKVWEETEKHLAWVVNGKADISFSALITSLKLPMDQVRMPAAVVWDNFTILTRGYEASRFEDLLGHEIYTPLFKEAPPTTLTRYLMKRHGLDPDAFTFVYGKPFGRPPEIMRAFVQGDADTVMLREPEASFAIHNLPAGVVHSELPYVRLWKQVHEGQESFPNATVLVKNAFVKQHPEVAQIFLEETRAAIAWVGAHPEASARQCADIMGQSEEAVRRFLGRVNFDYVDGEQLVSKATRYIAQLHDAGLVRSKIDPAFFRLP